MASTRSRMTAIRTRGSVPWLRISVRFQPAPTPNSKRPPDRWSTLATSFAVMIGSRSMIRQMPLATRILRVASAAAVSATKRSYVRQYFAGNGCPGGLRGRDVGVLSEVDGVVAALLGNPRDLTGPHTVVGGKVSETEFHTQGLPRRVGLPPHAPGLSRRHGGLPARRTRPPGS